MPTVAVVYHSEFGHTRAVAESIARGAESVEGITAKLMNVSDLPLPSPTKQLVGLWDDLADADAIVMGCPTYMGTISAKLKTFMESSGQVWAKQGWRDKLAAGFTNAGGLSGDKLNALIDISMFAAQHSMIWVSQGLFCNDAGINRMGSWIGMQAQSENLPADQTPPPEDHRTAELFGERIARATLRWSRGT